MEYIRFEILDAPESGPSSSSPPVASRSAYIDWVCEGCGVWGTTFSSQSIIRHFMACRSVPQGWKPITGRGALLTCGDVEANPGPKEPHQRPPSHILPSREAGQGSPSGPSAKPFCCPWTDCPWEATGTRGPLIKHLNSLHLPAQQVPAPTWVHLMGLWHCQACNLLIQSGRQCTGFRHMERERPQEGPSHSLDTNTPTISIGTRSLRKALSKLGPPGPFRVQKWSTHLRQTLS